VRIKEEHHGKMPEEMCVYIKTNLFAHAAANPCRQFTGPYGIASITPRKKPRYSGWAKGRAAVGQMTIYHPHHVFRQLKFKRLPVFHFTDGEYQIRSPVSRALDVVLQMNMRKVRNTDGAMRKDCDGDGLFTCQGIAMRLLRVFAAGEYDIWQTQQACDLSIILLIVTES